MERYKRSGDYLDADINESFNRILSSNRTKRLRKSYKLSDEIGQRVLTANMNVLSLK